MGEAIHNQYVPEFVSPPGETLLETIEALGMSQADLAERSGRTRKTINEIIKGKAPISQKIALEFERVLGIPASFWNSREAQYREALARNEEQDRLGKQVEWLKTVPVKAMAERGWINLLKDKVHQLREVLNFFGIASPEQWDELQSKYDEQIAFRKSQVFESDPGSLIAWFRRGEIEAQGIKCAVYDAGTFRTELNTIRSLTKEPPEVFQPELTRLCANCGVAVLFVPELPKLRVSGATRWLSARKALIQLTLRYKTDDHLWFTFFHEAGHILLHGKRTIFLEGNEATSPCEKEADEFAAQMLIPEAVFSHLKLTRRISKAMIRQFAADIGIAPGIVVGRLQHDRILPMSYLNDLKRRFVWATDAS